MAKFYGVIGYKQSKMTAPGVWSDEITEYNYSGDVIRNNKRWQAGESLNDNLNINNVFSIIADPFAYNNLESMLYIKWMGTLWKIINVDIQRPRLTLTVGGVYNGKTPKPSEST